MGKGISIRALPALRAPSPNATSKCLLIFYSFNVAFGEGQGRAGCKFGFHGKFNPPIRIRLEEVAMRSPINAARNLHRSLGVGLRPRRELTAEGSRREQVSMLYRETLCGGPELAGSTLAGCCAHRPRRGKTFARQDNRTRNDLHPYCLFYVRLPIRDISNRLYNLTSC